MTRRFLTNGTLFIKTSVAQFSSCRLTVCFLPTGRRSAPPLNLTGLPGTEKLNEREKEVWQTRFYLQPELILKTSASLM